MTNPETLAMIREMEKAGCELTFHVSTQSDAYTVIVQHQGQRIHVAKAGGFDIEEAYRRWQHTQRVVRPQERRNARTWVQRRPGNISPHVAEAGAGKRGIA